MQEKSRKVIVRNVKKMEHGHHGGSWKVAYADFITAMMAFFLLMWLLAMVSPEKRQSLSLYFKHFSLFDKSGKSYMEVGGPKLILDNSSSTDSEMQEGEAGMQGGLTVEEENKSLLAQKITRSLDDQKNQVIVDISKNGIRVQITDLDGAEVFSPGSAQLTERGRKILDLVAANARGLPNKIVIEGHTDAAPAKGEITNWELSSARACSARRELEAAGIDGARIVRVTGFADKAPLIENQPMDSRNRRISIIFLYSSTYQVSPGVNIYDALGARE